MTDEKSKQTKEDDSWSKSINTIVNLIVVTALTAMVFGFFAVFGAMFALKIF